MEPRVTHADADLEADHAAEMRRLLLELDLARAAGRAAERRLDTRFAEIAQLTHRLREHEASASREADHRRWLVELHVALADSPRWWALLPRAWRRRRQRTMLRRRGLFDAAAYIVRYPDVAAAGIDPLQHYLLHGIDEDRRR